MWVRIPPRARALLQTAEEEMRAAWEEGRPMTREQALAFARGESA